MAQWFPATKKLAASKTKAVCQAELDTKHKASLTTDSPISCSDVIYRLFYFYRIC
jgi:hypothetical protein